MARTRSPSYPGIDLKESIEKAEAIYRREGTSPALVDTIAAHWGYKPGTGSANVAIAALRKFGLVDYEGSGSSRKAKLTDTALRIIRDERQVSPDREASVRRIALRPDIHKELWEKTKDGASDETLVSFLKLERAFSDAAAPDLVDEFRRTAAYANLSASDIVGDTVSDDANSDATSGDGSEGSVGETQADPSRSGALRTFRLPLTSRSEAVLQVPVDMTEAKWDQMMAVLSAMKVGILSEENEE